MASEYTYPDWYEEALTKGYFIQNPISGDYEYKNLEHPEKNYSLKFNPITDYQIERGDIICFGGRTYRNEGVYIWDGKKIISLDTDIDDYGSVPHEFKVGKEFAPDHWVKIIEHNCLIHLEDELIDQIKFYKENNKIYGKLMIFDKDYTIIIQEADDLNEEEIREQLKDGKPCFNLYTNNVLEVYIN